MPNCFISSDSDYEEVRKRISIYLDDETLPNDVIALDTYAGIAESYVLTRTGKVCATDGQTPGEGNTFTAAEEIVAKRTAILYCAAILMPAVPQLVQNAVDEIRLSFQNFDFLAHQEVLFAAVTESIKEIIPSYTPTKTVYPLFIAAAGGRGKTTP